MVTRPQAGRAAVDFFVSYDEADRAWAEWISWQLENAGYTVRLRAWDHELAGGNLVLSEDKDLASAERLIAVMSPTYRLSPNTQHQWSAFLRQDPTGERRRVVPVEIAPTERVAILGTLEPVSLCGMSERAARDALLAAVQATRLKPSRAPGYPGRGEPAFPTRTTPAMRADTKMLLAFVLLCVGWFFWGYLAYTGDAGDNGDMVRAIGFLVVVGTTLRMARRWWHRRF